MYDSIGDPGVWYGRPRGRKGQQSRMALYAQWIHGKMPSIEEWRRAWPQFCSFLASWVYCNLVATQALLHSARADFSSGSQPRPWCARENVPSFARGVLSHRARWFTLRVPTYYRESRNGQEISFSEMARVSRCPVSFYIYFLSFLIFLSRIFVWWNNPQVSVNFTWAMIRKWVKVFRP